MIARGCASFEIFRTGLERVPRGPPGSVAQYDGPKVGERFSFVYTRGARAGDRRTVVVQQVHTVVGFNGEATFKLDTCDETVRAIRSYHFNVMEKSKY